MDFKKRVNKAISTFVKTKTELVNINTEINKYVDLNNKKIDTLTTENSVNTGLFESNSKIIKNIDNILNN